MAKNIAKNRKERQAACQVVIEAAKKYLRMVPHAPEEAESINAAIRVLS